MHCLYSLVNVQVYVIVLTVVVFTSVGEITEHSGN
jgi:hypothetical protein